MAQALNTHQAEAAAILQELTQNVEVLAMLDKLQHLQRLSEAEGWWDHSTGHDVENASGHLVMALEAAGTRF